MTSALSKQPTTPKVDINKMEEGTVYVKAANNRCSFWSSFTKQVIPSTQIPSLKQITQCIFSSITLMTFDMWENN